MKQIKMVVETIDLEKQFCIHITNPAIPHRNALSANVQFRNHVPNILMHLSNGN